jgi:8-oxo-dGTP pyrophosphatase MutT (NUDIX family)
MSLPPSSPPRSSSKKIRPVISCLLKHGKEILILKRSKHVGSFQGFWSCISGYLEAGEDPQQTAYREVFEETQLPESVMTKTTYAGPFYPEAEDVIFETHWFLLETNLKKITLDWEHDEYRWISPEELSNYQIIPWLPTLTDHLFAKQSTE